jgi:hypothetical protein
MIIKEKREIIIRYVNSVLRKKMGGNDGVHKINEHGYSEQR